MARGIRILDHRGEPIRREVLTRELSGPTITGVRSIWSTGYSRDLTPARLAAILRESETPGDGSSEDYVELAEVMEERDLHYLGCLQTRKRQVAQIGITIEPASDSAEDVKDAELVKEFLGRDDLEDELIDLLDALGKGYSVAEIIWETSERQWMPQRLEWRLPRWFDFDRASGQRLMRRGDDSAWMELEPWKFVTHTTRAKSGLPIRGGLARIAAWAWIFKSYSLKDWVRFVEAYGQPMRLGKFGKNASDEDRAVLYRAVRNIGVDAAAIVPEEMGIEFITDSTVRGRSEIYRDLVTYIDNQISIAVLGQTLTTQPGESGSYALGAVHNLVREDIEKSDGRQLAATLKRDIIIPIVTLNHGPRKAYPRAVIERVSEPDLDMLSQSLERLVPLGLKVRADQVRTMFGLETPGEDDELLEVRTPSPPPMPGSTDPPLTPPARARDAGGENPSATAATEDDLDPVPALVARARDELGPLVDAWSERIQDGLGGAGSLEEVRDRLDTLLAWTRAPNEPTPDVAETVEAIGTALVAGHLAGRYDIEERIALAGASFEHTQLPFAEQIDFFRSKVDLPTESWTDVWEKEHDRAFVVAGAAHADLVSDLRAAVDGAIADGTTIETFRQEFDAIVAKHGWSYKGGRDWRTRVIYDTNLRSSYAAGRLQQMRDVADRRPYWRYRHSDASEHPREEHLEWDGLVLRHDDPWWDTHYPPNGWGCKCFVETLSENDLESLGKPGPDQAPPIETRTVTVGTQGPNPRTVEVPKGIDPGWAYAPGQSVVDNKPTPADPWAIGELSHADATARQIGRAQGSNPGGLFEGADGKARYVKFYDDPAQAYGEAVANRVYRELGIDAPVSSVVRDGDRIVGIANELIDNAGNLGKGTIPKGRAKQVLKGYSADVWLANWDAVGLDLDNVVKSRKAWNAVARVDQGGALLMRARQGRKPLDRLDRITEWDGFANPARNPAYAKLIRAAGYQSPDELGRQGIKQIEAIEALGKRTNDFKDLAPFVNGVAEADTEAIRTLLSNRVGLLKSEIVPRLRATTRRGPKIPDHQDKLRREMDMRYNHYLHQGQQKVRGGFDSYGMTDPELATSYAYTTSEQPWGYYRPNKALRDAAKPGGPPVPERFEVYRLTLNDALDRLPDHQATGLKRGTTLSEEGIARYVPGTVVTEAAFTSASIGRPFSGNVRFTISSLHGKRIERLSAYPSEKEVLFRAGSRFRVVKRLPKGGTTYIDLEEVDDG